MNSFWNRYIRIQIGQLEIENKQLEIQFKIKSAPDVADEAEIVIYNLTEFTKYNLFTKAPISIEAGYFNPDSPAKEANYGVVHVGTLWEWFDEYDGADLKTTIVSHSMVSELADVKLARTYPVGTRKIDVAKEMVKKAVLVFVKIDESNSDVYTKPKTYTEATTCMQNLTQIAKEIDYMILERKGGIIFIPKNTGITEGFILNANTGMIACKRIVQTKEDDTADTGILSTITDTVIGLLGNEESDTAIRDFEVTTLLMYQLAIGSIVELESRVSNGKRLCKIVEMTMQSTGQEHTNTLQLKIV